MAGESPVVYRTVAAGGPQATPQALLPEQMLREAGVLRDLRVDLGVVPRCADEDDP